MADISKIKLPGDATARTIKDAAARSVQHTATLAAASWSGASAPYTYTLSLPALKCGSDGTVSPIIAPTSNIEEYSLIDSATATAGTGIVFSASTKPTNAIGIIIVDVG